jgi:four helix bundle protein
MVEDREDIGELRRFKDFNILRFDMATFKSFEDLPIWNEAGRLAKEIYTLTQQNAFSKDFALRDQIRKSAGSVMDNIAEGYERDSRLEFINFLSIAKGSAGEVRSQLFRAYDLNYITEEELHNVGNAFKELSSHIANFIKYLNNSTVKGQKFKDRLKLQS